MDPAIEIPRLLDVMPASGRMNAKITSKPEMPKAIDSPFPVPWRQEWPILINFDLWSQLSLPQRDLLLLRTVTWLQRVQWLKLDLYQGVAIAGFLGSLIELAGADPVGAIAAGGLSFFAGSQIWRNNRSTQSELAADEAAIQVAQRRGYSETEAAAHLLAAIETTAKIERRPSLSFSELIRCQNLRAIAGISPLGVPKEFWILSFEF